MKAGFVDLLKVVMAVFLDVSRVASLLGRCTHVVEASEEDEPGGGMDVMDFNQSVGARWISKTLFSIVLLPTHSLHCILIAVAYYPVFPLQYQISDMYL